MCEGDSVKIGAEIVAHYSMGVEADRLKGGTSRLELRGPASCSDDLPPPPARVLDVAAGPEHIRAG